MASTASPFVLGCAPSSAIGIAAAAAPTTTAAGSREGGGQRTSCSASSRSTNLSLFGSLTESSKRRRRIISSLDLAASSSSTTAVGSNRALVSVTDSNRSNRSKRRIISSLDLAASSSLSSSSSFLSSSARLNLDFLERLRLARRIGRSVSCGALGGSFGGHPNNNNKNATRHKFGVPSRKYGVELITRSTTSGAAAESKMAEEEDGLQASCSNSTELREREEHAKAWAHQPRRIALFVEPSPFAYICGYKNRFQNFIRYLREMGDEVLIVTTHRGLPTEFYGAKVVGSWSFPCPWYDNLFLSLALSPRIYREVADFKPDIIHASSPGIMVFGALIIAKLLSAPIVMSYHTHVPMYIPKYTFSWLVTPMWWVIRLLHRAADWTLVVSQVLGKELKNQGAAAADRIGVWSKGVDSESFHPRFKSWEKRVELTNGKPETPLIVHVGRLGAEKNLDFLKKVMERLPEAHIAFIGDGPYRKDLEHMFKGMKVTFTGMLSGEELSKAYASGDIFITPSETETLGFVVLEAMASGVPVVAARAGGIIDIVNKEGETGFLYSPGDLEDCVSRLKDLLESPELREKIGRAGREEVENFDWRASTKQVRNEMYTSAIWFWCRKRQEWANRFSWFSRPASPALSSS